MLFTILTAFFDVHCQLCLWLSSINNMSLLHFKLCQGVKKEQTKNSQHHEKNTFTEKEDDWMWLFYQNHSIFWDILFSLKKKVTRVSSTRGPKIVEKAWPCTSLASYRVLLQGNTHCYCQGVSRVHLTLLHMYHDHLINKFWIKSVQSMVPFWKFI